MVRSLIISGVMILLLLVICSFSFWALIDGSFISDILSPDPVDPIKLTYNPGEIPSAINQSIAEATRDLDALATVPDSSRTFQNTGIRLDNILTTFDDQTLKYSLIGDIYSDLVVAQEARQASYLRDEFLNRVYLRKDLAHALKMVTPNPGINTTLKDRLVNDFNLSSLPDPVHEEITRLGQNLSEPVSAYIANQHGSNASMNLPLITPITSIRQQIVTLLGYQSFADYQITESGMSVNQTEMLDYLYQTSESFRQASHEEAAVLLREKQKNDSGAVVVYDYEIPLLRARISSQANTPNGTEISTFFPAEHVIERMNALMSEIFGISITPVSSSHFIPGMLLFRITNDDSPDIRAWFYVWIQEEEGIHSISGRTYFLRAGHESNGSWIPPVSAMILSVPTGKNSSQTYLSPVDLQVLFHEYGHLLRHSLATARYGTLSSGTRDPGGYSELFSLFLEKFLWTPDVLDWMAGSSGTGYILPSKLRDQVIADHGEEAGWGTGYIRMYPYFLSLLDLEIHEGNESTDFFSMYSQIYENSTGYSAASGVSSLLLNPAFFISDNAGTYWHYVLDDIYAEDLFSRFEKEGVMNQSTGITFRKELFEPAGSTNFPLLMQNFLGYRPPGPPISRPLLAT
jgi:Zn-dependent oligopeptidase